MTVPSPQLLLLGPVANLWLTETCLEEHPVGPCTPTFMTALLAIARVWPHCVASTFWENVCKVCSKQTSARTLPFRLPTVGDPIESRVLQKLGLCLKNGGTLNRVNRAYLPLVLA